MEAQAVAGDRSASAGGPMSSQSGSDTGRGSALLVAQAGAPPLLHLLMGQPARASTGAGSRGEDAEQASLRERFCSGAILLVGPEGGEWRYTVQLQAFKAWCHPL